MATRTINVGYLARVEGEGALHLRIRKGVVEDVQLKIFEPPRFFEAFLRGRHCLEAPDITARICGICPVAYQMSAVHAVERALGVEVTGALRDLRRLLYCGEWIESHTLHVFMLHAPDFLGYPDAIAMAKDHPGQVKAGLALKKAGNALVALLGGREIHPINVRVGGFYRAPTEAELGGLLPQLREARNVALAAVGWVATFRFPALVRDYEYVAVRHPDEYPMNEGRIVSSKGLDLDASDYDAHFEELHVPYTNALQSVVKGRGAYLTGPMARFNLCRAQLSPAVRAAAAAAGIGEGTSNPFHSIIVRSLEILHACDEAIRIIEGYRRPPEPAVDVQPGSGIGWAVTEAPRGLLYHRYELDGAGLIVDARIVPPTSQNQKSIEDDLRQLVPPHVKSSKAELTHLCEQAIRNHDPCISCATHFLKLEVDEA